MTAAFERIAKETGRVDILVNNVWGGYERMVEDGTFTWTKPFWEQGLWGSIDCKITHKSQRVDGLDGQRRKIGRPGSRGKKEHML